MITVLKRQSSLWQGALQEDRSLAITETTIVALLRCVQKCSSLKVERICESELSTNTVLGDDTRCETAVTRMLNSVPAQDTPKDQSSVALAENYLSSV